MGLFLNPYTWMAVQWVVSRGAPIVTRRLVAPVATALPRFEGEATLERGGEQVQGRLAVTDRELVFTANSAGALSQLRLSLASVEEVTPVRRRLLGLIPLASSAIRVRATSGSYRFDVEPAEQERWLREIRRAALLGE